MQQTAARDWECRQVLTHAESSMPHVVTGPATQHRQAVEYLLRTDWLRVRVKVGRGCGQGYRQGLGYLLRPDEQVQRPLVVRQCALEVLVLARQVRQQHVYVCGEEDWVRVSMMVTIGPYSIA